MFDPMRPRRSVLYLPANRESAVAKARGLAADCVILDLEDAVQPEAKDAARAAAVLAAGMDWGGRELLLRVNGLGTAWCEADFAAAARFDGVVVPKVETADEAARAVALAGRPVWVMIETPKGVLAAAAIAAVPGVVAVIAGLADLAKDLRALPDAGRAPLMYGMQAMLMAARAAGVLAFDGVFGDIHDDAGFLAEARQGRMLGFDGKTLIHPSQVGPCNLAFSPSEAALAEAAGLIAAYEDALAAGRGVATYKGRMVEVLHVVEARRVLTLGAALAG